MLGNSNYFSINSYSSGAGENVSVKITNRSYSGSFDTGRVTIGKVIFN